MTYVTLVASKLVSISTERKKRIISQIIPDRPVPDSIVYLL